MGDTAIATVERICGAPGGAISRGENILLVRQSGKWRIEKVISGFSKMAM